MKIAFYVEDGIHQIVLTPVTKFEQDILGKLHEGDQELQVLRGSFYECRGGWIRQSMLSSLEIGGAVQRGDDESTMLVLVPKKEEQVTEPRAMDPNDADLARALNKMGFPMSPEAWKNSGDNAPVPDRASAEVRHIHTATIDWLMGFREEDRAQFLRGH